MVEAVEVIDDIKIFEFSTENKLFRHTFSDEFARRDDTPFLGFDVDDLYYSNQIHQKFSLWHSQQSLQKQPGNQRGRKRKSDTPIKTEFPPKRNSEGLSRDTSVLSVGSKSEIQLEICDAPIPKPSITHSQPHIVETIILDDESDADSNAASVDSGTETMRVVPDGPTIIEIEDSDSESVDSAISISSPLSQSSTPVSLPKFPEPTKKVTDQPSLGKPAVPLSTAFLPARAHVITVEPSKNFGKTQNRYHVVTNQNHSSLKQWGVQKKNSPPLRQQKRKSPILKESIADCQKKNLENVDNNNLVVPDPKTTCAYSLACLSPGVGYIPLLEFGINTIKFQDPFGSGKVKMYANVMHATKWLNSEVQARLNFEACTELKWTVVNAVIVQAKRLSRFDFHLLSQPNCRITKNGAIFS